MNTETQARLILHEADRNKWIYFNSIPTELIPRVIDLIDERYIGRDVLMNDFDTAFMIL